MKHLTKSTKWMIGSLTFAVALTSLAQNTSGQERLLTQNDVANKLQQYSVESEGVSIRPADASLVWSAAEQFKGKNVSLDLPKSGDALASNSVLIGSGSDGLVSDNNLEKKDTQYILNPPFKPKTSITLVGRPNSLDEKYGFGNNYCGVNLLPNLNDSFVCTQLNVPLRAQQGTYLINYMGMNLKLNIKENENKIVYLREIFVPKQIRPISYQLKMHRSDSNQISGIIETMNRVKDVEPKCYYNSIFQATYSPKPYSLTDKLFVDKNCEYYLYSIANKSIKNYEFYYKFYDSITFATGVDNSFISVLPGVYNVEWTIDGQKETTELKID